MKLNQILLIVGLLYCGTSISYSQKMTVYKTFEDYSNDKGVEYDEFRKTMTVVSNLFLFVKKGKKKSKISCKEIWGFKYGDALFRIDQEIFYPARLMVAENLYYWENGIGHLIMIRDNKEIASYRGFDYYLSKDLTSKMVGISFSNSINASMHDNYRKFKQDYPEFTEIYDCIEEYLLISIVRDCINRYFK